MKKLLLSSIVLFLFSASLIVFQMSCKKEAKAENPSVTQEDEGLKQLGKILYEAKDDEYWLMNYDGTGKQKLNISIPSGETSIDQVKLSPDGQRVFFITVQEVGAPQYEYFRLYSCKLDGSGVKKILDNVDKLSPGTFEVF